MLGSGRRLITRSTCSRLFQYSRNYCSHDDPSSIPHYNEIYQRFKESGIPDAESSAKWIALHVQEDPSLLETLINCRLSRMPLQYILKEWPFRGLNLRMKPPVFIPRPETEKIIELAASLAPTRVLEIGCGSGAISLALLSEIPAIESIIAVDRSRMAVNLTQENADRVLSDDHRSKLQVLLNPLDSGGTFDKDLGAKSPFDLVVSNPPYILRKDLHNVEPEIGLYEDLRALDGGADGLDVVKGILTWVETSNLFHASRSRLLLELDPCHPSIVLPKYLEESPGLCLSIEAVHKDFLGRERFVVIKKDAMG